MADAISSLSAKLNRLFATFHTVAEPEQTNAAVAKAISADLGRIVPSDTIERLRVGEGDTRSGTDLDDVLHALAHHFGVEGAYLTDTDPVVDTSVDTDCRLLVAAREVGVRTIAMRGSNPDTDALARELTRIATTLPKRK